MNVCGVQKHVDLNFMLLTVPIKYAKGEKTLRKILFDYIFRNLFVLNATLDIAPDGALVLFVVQDVVKKLLLNHLLALLLVMLLKSRNQYSKIISREILFFLDVAFGVYIMILKMLMGMSFYRLLVLDVYVMDHIVVVVKINSQFV